MLHSAPRVLNRFQNSEYRIVGRLALAAIAKAERHQEGDVLPVGEDAADDRQDADHDGRDPGDPDLAVRR